jgi:hypothetical protein
MNRQTESDKGFSEDVMFAFQVIFFCKKYSGFYTVS